MKTNKSMKALAIFAGAVLAVSPAFAGTLYSDVQSGDASGNPEQATSWAGYANGLTSFGNLISVAAGTADSATVFLSNYSTSDLSADLTLNLYQVNVPVTGPQSTVNIGTDTTNVASVENPTASIAGRPAPSGTSTLDCGSSNPASFQQNGIASCGELTGVTFALGGLSLAGNYVWTLTMNGEQPQSLNWALNDWYTDPTSISTAGNPAYDTAYLNGLADTGWANIGQGEIAINGNLSGTPEPATFGLIGLGLVGLGAAIRKRSRKA